MRKSSIQYDSLDKRHLVFGFGVEGKSVVDFFLRHDVDVDVYDESSDKLSSEEVGSYREKGISFFSQFDDLLLSYEVIVRSPGIMPSHSFLKKAEKRGAVVTSSTQIFFDLCPCQIIGVSGTKGKGTTSALIFEMLTASGKDTYLGGNIGTPLLSFFEKLSQKSVVVIELSSFQLIDLKVSPHIAVLLMVVPEHLDYHANFEEYISAKRNLVRYQKVNDFAIFNHDFPASNESDVLTSAYSYYVSRCGEVLEGCYIDRDKVVLKIDEEKKTVICVEEIELVGAHNLENVCASSLASYLAGVSIEDISHVLACFGGLEHRLEFVREQDEVRYYNDSFSTIPETTIAAIEAFSEPLVLILGGSSKESDFSELGDVISRSNIRAIVGVGKEWEKIKNHVTRKNITIVENCKTMKEIVSSAQAVAKRGDVVLLSPACASFDMFENYKQRGDEFKLEVSKL